MSDGSGYNFDDFVLAISAVFDDASSTEATREILEFAKRAERAATQAAKGAEYAQKREQTAGLKARQQAQKEFNRRWTDAEKHQARAMLLVAREFYRERALQEREAAQSERREYERRSKQQLADRRAAQQRQGKILDEGLKQASARLKSGLKIREQDNASGLRRFENQEKEAARNLERLAKEQARERERIAKEAAANLARIEKERIAQALLASKEQSAVARREGERLAQQQRQQDRLLFNSEQESSARRIARSKALYSTLTTIARSGAQATTNVVTSFLRRRENAAKQTGDRITNIDRSTTNRSTSIIRQQLDEQNAVYSRAAAKRLATIERTAAQERVVITRNAVKTAEAQAEIQRRTSSGLLGAATGRSVAGGNLQGFLYGAAGLYGIKKLVDASSDLAESQSKVRVVFGENSKAVEDFAARASRAIGESEQATLEAAGTYGNLFQSFGLGRDLATEYSISLVKLASDLASFNNTSVQDAIEALRSGLTGETEPLKRYGIAINETLLKQEAARLGIVKSTVSQTALTKSTIATEKAQRKVTEAIKKYGASSLEARDAQASLDAAVEKAGKTLAGKTPAQLTSAQKAQAAYSLIMQRSTLAQGDFNRTQAGFANQSRIVVARLKDLQAAAGNGLLPIALALAGVFNNAVLPALESFTDVTSGLIRNLAEGKGGWKIARDGITGVAVALGALLAVKAGAEVLGIVANGLKLIGGAAVANPGLAALVALAGVGTILYRNAPGVKNFFDSLIEGTKNWYLVGYRISQPIENLSKLVLLQSSFGAAAAVVVDGFEAILRGVDDLRNGLGTDALEEALRQTLRGLGDVLSPAKNLVADSLRESFKRGRDFLNNEALPILQQARLNVGSFLLPLLGLTGGDGGVVSRLVSSAITKLFLGSITAFDPTRPSAELGAKAREIIDRAIEIAQAGATNVRAFFSSLFGADVDTDSLGSILGGRVNEAITSAFSRLKERLGPIGDLLSSIGDAIATGFGRYVLPKLIELPRIAGRFISRTVFSEEFLKAVAITGAAIAGVALVVAGQFVRGFIEGLIQRRGDIAGTVRDILVFTVQTIIGSGNPLVLLGGALIAAFAGAKVLGAIGNLRAQFRIAAAGMTGDAQKVQAAIAQAVADKRPATNSKVGNAALTLSDGYRKAEVVVTRVGKRIENAGAKTVQLGGFIDTVGNRLLKLPLDTVTTRTGKLVSASTGRFVKDTTAGLNGLQRRAGEFANKYASLLSDPLTRAGAALQSFPRTVQARLQQAGGFVSGFATKLKDEVPTGADRAQAAMQVAAGAISGYMTGMAETGQAKALGLVASLGTITAAYATTGPIVGSITAIATGIAFFWGNSTRAAEKAQAIQKKIAADVAAGAEEVGAAYRNAFKDQGGSTTSEGRVTGTLRITRDLLDANSKKARDFSRRFGTDLNDVAVAAGGTRKEFESFTKLVISRNVSKVIAGDTAALKNFAAETRIAGRAATESLLESIANKEDSATFERILQASGVDIVDLQKKVQTGAVGIGEFRDQMKRAGFSTEEADAAYRAYKGALTEAIGNTPGGIFLSSLPGQLEDAVRQQALLNEANDELQSRLEQFGPYADRFSSAWGRIKSAIDKAKDAYLSWVDASTGRQLSRAEAISGLFGAAQNFTTPQEGENALLAEARQTQARAEARRVIAGQLQELAKRAGGDPRKLTSLINDFFNELRAGTSDQATIDFFNQIQYLTADPQSIQILVDAQPAIEGINGLRTQVRTLLQLPENSPMRVSLEKARNFDEAKMLIGADLIELGKQDPRIQAYIEKNGGFDAVVAAVAGDAAFIDGLAPKIKVGFDVRVQELVDAVAAGLKRIGSDISLAAFEGETGGRRWGGIDSFARGGFTQAHIQRRQRIKYAEPETGGEAYIPRRGIRSRSEAILRQAAQWVGGTFVPGGRLTAMAGGGVWGDTTGWQYRNGWWYDRSGRRVGYARYEDEPIYDRPGGRRLGPAPSGGRRSPLTAFYSNVDRTGGLGSTFSFSNRRPDEGRTDTHVRNNWDGSIDVLEDGTNKVLEHFSAAVVKLNKIMASVNKAMTFAEARAAVLAATAAQRERGAGAYARWLQALTRFFSGGMATAHIKGNEFAEITHKPVGPVMGDRFFPKPERPAKPTPASTTDGAKTVINRNLTMKNTIIADPNPTRTALQVARKARDGDFLGGGHFVEKEFAV